MAMTGNVAAGKVVALSGKVIAVAMDGTQRALQVGDVLLAGERLLVPADAYIELQAFAGDTVRIAEASDLTVTDDVITAPVGGAEAQQVLAALASGQDPLTQLEAAAAGLGGAAAGAEDSGNTYIILGRIREGITPASLAQGVARAANLTVPAGNSTGLATPVVTEEQVTPPPPPPVPGVNVDDVSVQEGSPAIFSITLGNAAAGSTLTLTLADGSALSPEDYAGNAVYYSLDGGASWLPYGSSIAVSAGNSTVLVRVDTVADTVDEADELFNLGATLDSGGIAYSDSAVGGIQDDDIPSIQFVNPDSNSGDIVVPEGDSAQFTLQIRNTAEDSSLQLTLADGSALHPDDYAGTSFEYQLDGGAWQPYPAGGIAGLAAGDHVLLIRTSTVGDTTDEPDETFSLGASLLSNGSYYDASALATIVDDDITPPPPPPVLYEEGSSWLMNYADHQQRFDIKAKDGDITLLNGRSIYWDILVPGVVADTLQLTPHSLPDGTTADWEKLYTGNGDTLFRFYLTATDSDVVLSQNDQFHIYVNGAPEDSNIQLINSNEFVLPHSNFHTDYGTDFDTGTPGAGDDQNWLSSDGDGGEFADNTPDTPPAHSVDYGTGNDMAYGGTGDDSLQGGSGNDFLEGRAGDDTLSGDSGNDVLMGSFGSDTLSGGSGEDTLAGGFGNDILSGGDDSDTFDFNIGDQGNAGAPAVDTITDFTVGEGGDVIDLSDMLPNGNLESIDLGDYLHFSESDGNTVLHISSSGDFAGDVDDYGAVADQVILLQGVDLTLLGSNSDIIEHLKNNANLKTGP